MWQEVSKREKLFVIAGPCVMESYELLLEVCEALMKACSDLGLPFIFKSSYDKANRTSIASFRGPGLEKGLKWLDRLKKDLGVRVLTDVHSPEEAKAVSSVVDVIQIPAFLCRQTDIIVSAASTGRIVNLKKGQFMAPWDMKSALDKVLSCNNYKVLITERGTIFGYNNLVVDMRSIIQMKAFKVPVVFDATHSVQHPGGLGICSGGDRRFVPVLARAAVAAGADGIFMEVHPDPDKALCDGPNSIDLKDAVRLLGELKVTFELFKETYR